jgi:hypothetical protein
MGPGPCAIPVALPTDGSLDALLVEYCAQSLRPDIGMLGFKLRYRGLYGVRFAVGSGSTLKDQARRKHIKKCGREPFGTSRKIRGVGPICHKNREA